MLTAVELLLAAYVIGAIPTSYVVARWVRGIDLREHGSRNLGATNVFRVLGWKYAIPVGAFDVAKGALPVMVFGPLVPELRYFGAWCGLAAVLGHTLSPFVRFKGGKGVATAAGMLLALAPWAVLAAALVWGLVLKLSGYVSLSSIIAAGLFPAADYLLHPARRGAVSIGLDVALAGFIIWKHRANIQRLLQGTENRFGRRKPAAQAP